MSKVRTFFLRAVVVCARNWFICLCHIWLCFFSLRLFFFALKPHINIALEHYADIHHPRSQKETSEPKIFAKQHLVVWSTSCGRECVSVFRIENIEQTMSFVASHTKNKRQGKKKMIVHSHNHNGQILISLAKETWKSKEKKRREKMRKTYAKRMPNRKRII